MNKLIALLVLIQNCVVGQIQVPAKDGLDLFNTMMRNFFNNCRSEFGTIGFWGDDRIFLADDEADFVVLNKSEVFEKPPTRRIKFLVVILDQFNHDMPEIHLHKPMPALEIDTMFIYSKGYLSARSIIKMFNWYQQKFGYSKAYYCHETKGGIGIITMNAFADVAPKRWAMIKEIPHHYNDNIRLWRIYRTHYYENDEINYDPELCKNIFFDRTEKLNGYEIKASALIRNDSKPKFSTLNGLIDKKDKNSQNTSILYPTPKRFSKVLTKYLNVSVNVTHGVTAKQSNRLIRDMILNHTLDLNLIPTKWDSDDIVNVTNEFYLTYPLKFYCDLIVTHNRGLASPLEKMFEFYAWLTIIATFIILLITFIVIYLSNSKNNSRLSFAIFECLRLIISNPIYTRMDTFKMRIFFFVIFLYFQIIQPTFSGHLSAFLTKPVYKKNVETLEDLKDPRYTAIYASTRSRMYIKDLVLLNKTKFGSYECGKYIHDKSVACINEENYLKRLIVHYNLHTPKNARKSSIVTMTMSPNWGLRHRVNNMIMRLVQSGISDRWRTNLIRKQSWQPVNMEFRKLRDLAENYHRPIEMGDVTFAFLLLAVGLISAIISFTVEYLMKILTLNKIKILLRSTKIKQYTVFFVRYVIFKFLRLLEWFYDCLLKIIGWMHAHILL